MSGGCPFGEKCLVYSLLESGTYKEFCDRLLEEVRALPYEGFSGIEGIFPMRGIFLNLEVLLPDGSRRKILSDNSIYLGGQAMKKDGRAYGFASSGKRLVVMEYSLDGKDAVLVLDKAL